MEITQTSSVDAVLQEIGTRIAQLRLSRNLSQAELADAAGIGLRTLQRLEDGAVAARFSSIIKVFQALGLSGRLNALVPQPQASPIELLELESNKRQRASKKQVSEAGTSWSWGE